MSTLTTVYSLVKHARGDTPWDVEVNADLDTIDSEIARPRIPFNSPVVGATTTCDLSLARLFVFTVSQATTLAFTNVPSSSFAVRIRLVVTNGSAFVLTFPASVSWLNAIAPVLRVAGVDEIELVTKDGGTTWFASIRHDHHLLFTAAVDNTTTNSGAGSPANLKSYVLPAAALDASGRGLRITAWGTTANNANAKVFRVAFGATLVVNYTLIINIANAWVARALVYRTGAATQDALQEYAQHFTNIGSPIISNPAETLSGAVTIQCSCTQVAAADVIQEGLMVELLG